MNTEKPWPPSLSKKCFWWVCGTVLVLHLIALVLVAWRMTQP